MLKRQAEIDKLKLLISIFPVTAILGARQVGKSTLAHQIQADHYFDLENPVDLVKFDNPQFLINSLNGLIIIDEIQLKPELFPLLRYQCDNRHDQKFIVLGSASTSLIKGSSETLAGRIGYHFLGGFRLSEVEQDFRRLWMQGAFPRAFLLDEGESSIWRNNFITTFLERDIPQLGITIPSNTLRRFWTMLSHYHGQIINYSELSRSFGVSDMTIRRYLEILEGAFMIRILQPWHANLGKRLVKAPKLYFRDSGMLHTLLTINSFEQLVSNPKVGASWEGFCIENAIRTLNKRSEEVFFYSTHSGAEVDLFWQWGGKNYAIEVKFSDKPRISRSLTTSINDLQIDRAWIIYPGDTIIPINEKVSAIPVTSIESELKFLFDNGM
jgi:hypothetical protein